MTKLRGLWVWGLPAACLVCAGVLVFNDTNIDVFFPINQFSVHTGGWIWAVLTVLCDGLIAFVLFFPLIRRRPRLIWAALVAALVSLILSQVLKRIWNMPRPPKFLRPQDFHLIGPDWGHFAFPSGHAAMAMILGYAFASMAEKAWVRLLIIAGACLMALSRVVVGVHWPLDVLIGSALGWLCGWMGFLISEKTTWGWGTAAQRLLGAVLLTGCLVLLAVDYSGYGLIWEQRALALGLLILGLPEYLKLFGIKLPGLGSVFRR
jgi:membrane-associated phospholipid phosphatase